MHKPVLLVAEDDGVDAMLLERAIRKHSGVFLMVRVVNGDELIQYLEGIGVYSDRAKYPLPALLFLDLKMPGTDGFGVLRWRQTNPIRARVPVIVFSSSSIARDIEQAYLLGANSYVVKPAMPDALEKMIKALGSWWGDFNITTGQSFIECSP